MHGINVFDADVTNFYFAVVWVDINWLASEFSVDYIMLMEEDQTFEDLFWPILNDLESGRMNFLAVPN